MYVLLYHISQECRRHAEEENGEAECPLRCALGETDVIRNFLAEYGPAVDRTDTAMQQKRRNSGTYPFVLTCFHCVRVLSYVIEIYRSKFTFFILTRIMEKFKVRSAI